LKTWPVYHALSQKPHLETVVVQSGQHDDLATQAFKDFNFCPDISASIKSEDKLELGYLHSAITRSLTDIFMELEPDMVLVHGDTTTAFSGAVAAFLRNIPIGHIEAGLRTSRFERPFPEEGYRRAISRFTTLHFAPTKQSALNLVAENINTQHVHITGNTVVDSLKHILTNAKKRDFGYEKVILVTAHRRETYGAPLIAFCMSLAKIAEKHKDALIVWPVHQNPKIQHVANNYLHTILNVQLIPPISYLEFIETLNVADIVVTDSGGVMEEAGVLNKPTIVLRNETERPEILSLDYIKLVGYNFEKLEKIIDYWFLNPPTKITQFNNLFGRGTAGEEIAEIIDKYFKDKS
jgi:UDP-N-acetylglucosamine 2-epimerase (non-hydrolysing)